MVGNEERFKAGTFENEKQKKCCSWGNSLSHGMLPRNCYSFLAKATENMKRGVQQTEPNCGRKQSFMEVSSLQNWDVQCESNHEATLLSQWHLGRAIWGSGLSLTLKSYVRSVGMTLWSCNQGRSFSGGSWELQPSFLGTEQHQEIINRKKLETQGNLNPKKEDKEQMCSSLKKKLQMSVVTSAAITAGAENCQIKHIWFYIRISELQILGNTEGIWEP